MPPLARVSGIPLVLIDTLFGASQRFLCESAISSVGVHHITEAAVRRVGRLNFAAFRPAINDNHLGSINY